MHKSHPGTIFSREDRVQFPAHPLEPRKTVLRIRRHPDIFVFSEQTDHYTVQIFSSCQRMVVLKLKITKKGKLLIDLLKRKFRSSKD